MQDVLEGLYAVVQQRKAEPQEGSYTCYLFETGRTALFSGAALPVFLSYHPCFFFLRFSKMICSRRSSRSFSCCLRSSTCRAQSEKF